MKPSRAQFLHWTPRILGLALGLFVAVFALDVFAERRPLGETLLAFLIHLLPAAMVLAAVAVGWRWELAGGILFLGLAVWYLAMTASWAPWSAYLLFAGLPALLGILFLLDWRHRAARKRHA